MESSPFCSGVTHETRYWAGIVFHAGHYSSGWGGRRTYLLRWTEAPRMITVIIDPTAHFRMRSTRAAQESKARSGVFWLYTVAFLASIWAYPKHLVVVVPLRADANAIAPGYADSRMTNMLPIALSDDRRLRRSTCVTTTQHTNIQQTMIAVCRVRRTRLPMA